MILEIADKGRGMSNEERDKSQLPFYKILGIKRSAWLGLGHILCVSQRSTVEEIYALRVEKALAQQHQSHSK